MAQPAVPVNEERTDLLGIPPFWAKDSINPPFIWESWIGQIFLAAGLKDNINPHDLLIEPAHVLDEPPPRPETVADVEDAGADEARRHQAAVREIKRRFEELTNYTSRGGEKVLESVRIGSTTKLRLV